MNRLLPRLTLTAAFADEDDGFVLRNQTVAQRLGGVDGIVAREALDAGVAAADAEAVGKVLGRYRGSITGK